MTRGFAAIAWPAKHGNSGVMTFIVNQRDIVFQKDLGADTEQAVAAIQAFDPDESWEPTAESLPAAEEGEANRRATSRRPRVPDPHRVAPAPTPPHGEGGRRYGWIVNAGLALADAHLNRDLSASAIPGRYRDAPAVQEALQARQEPLSQDIVRTRRGSASSACDSSCEPVQWRLAKGWSSPSKAWARTAAARTTSSR